VAPITHPCCLIAAVGEYGASLNGTPASSGLTPGTRITIEYTTMRDDRLVMTNVAERLIKLNIMATWAELSAAYRMEIRRIFGMDTGHCCPVIPLPVRRHA
jgi:hypothetical protein